MWQLLILWLVACGGEGTEEPLVGAPAPAAVARQAPLAPPTATCPDERPVPTCAPEHLGVPLPLPDPTACEDRSDCLPTEFCGAGVCRTLEGETATLCIEGAFATGNVCDDIVNVRVKAIALEPDYYPLELVRLTAPLDVTDTCHTAARSCQQVDLGLLARSHTTVWVTLLPADDEPGSGYTSIARFGGPETLRSLINAGCTPMLGQQRLQGMVGVGTHIALWYP